MRSALLLLLLGALAAAEEDDPVLKDPADEAPVNEALVGAVEKVDGPPICPEGFVCIPYEGAEDALPPEWQTCGNACLIPGVASATDIMISLLLLAHSGMFSGLTLGLMSLDLAGLRIVISGGSPEEAQCALKILPLRKRGNLLLCTLLIGNTLVNAAFAIFSASFTGGLAGTLISTAFIVVIGEITPQSVCARHGLYIGALSIPIVKFYMIVLFPFAWPIALALDRLLGEEMGTVYNKKELEMLMQMHVDDEETNLTIRDQEIFRGMLSMADHCVRDIMTHLDDCYMIEVSTKLTFDKCGSLTCQSLAAPFRSLLSHFLDSFSLVFGTGCSTSTAAVTRAFPSTRAPRISSSGCSTPRTSSWSTPRTTCRWSVCLSFATVSCSASTPKRTWILCSSRSSPGAPTSTLSRTR